jgi:predicted transcriptional regulator
MRKTTIILDDERAKALDECRRFEKRTMKAVIENALDVYFQTHNALISKEPQHDQEVAP